MSRVPECRFCSNIEAFPSLPDVSFSYKVIRSPRHPKLRGVVPRILSSIHPIFHNMTWATWPTNVKIAKDQRNHAISPPIRSTHGFPTLFFPPPLQSQPLPFQGRRSPRAPSRRWLRRRCTTAATGSPRVLADTSPPGACSRHSRGAAATVVRDGNAAGDGLRGRLRGIFSLHAALATTRKANSHLFLGGGWGEDCDSDQWVNSNDGPKSA